MVAKDRVYNYRYEGEASDARSDEFKFVKYFLVLIMLLYLISSIWIFCFIFEQAEWEYNAKIDDARAYAGVTTWKWWTVAVVILADLLTFYFLYSGVWNENLNLILALAVLSYIYSLFGILNLYLRGSIVCFVFPFTGATLSVIMFLMQRNEDEEYRISKGLRLRQKGAPTMETFLDDHERDLARFD